jgi:hypothetical protein
MHKEKLPGTERNLTRYACERLYHRSPDSFVRILLT